MSLKFSQQRRYKKPKITQSISPPNCEWYTLKDFKLEQIPDKFIGCDFQRKVQSSHIQRIVKSILNNEFFDNTIRVIPTTDKKYKVIDGQHRLNALWILHRDYGLDKYDLVFQYFKDNQGVKVFQKINSGKTLTIADFLKSLDDGKKVFFNDLREVLSHSDSKHSLTYNSILQAISFIRKSNIHGVRKEEIEEFLNTIKNEEITHSYRIATAVRLVHSQTMSNKVFNAILIRPILYYGFRHEYSINDYEKAFFKILEHPKWRNYDKTRFAAAEVNTILKLTQEILDN